VTWPTPRSAWREGKQLIALDIADICDDAEIDLPGARIPTRSRNSKSVEPWEPVQGRRADRPFHFELIVDGITVTRVTGKEYDSIRREERAAHYVFERAL